MKFLIAFAALLAVAAAVYVPYSYSPYVATAPAVYGAHHLYKRQVYSPVGYAGYSGYAGYPYAASVHYRERRQIYSPAGYVSPVAAYSPYAHYY